MKKVHVYCVSCGRMFLFIGKLLALRNATIQKFKLIGIAELIYGIIFLGIAIAQLSVAAQGEFGWPLLNVGPFMA